MRLQKNPRHVFTFQTLNVQFLVKINLYIHQLMKITSGFRRPIWIFSKPQTQGVTGDSVLSPDTQSSQQSVHHARTPESGSQSSQQSSQQIGSSQSSSEVSISQPAVQHGVIGRCTVVVVSPNHVRHLTLTEFRRRTT